MNDSPSPSSIISLPERVVMKRIKVQQIHRADNEVLANLISPNFGVSCE